MCMCVWAGGPVVGHDWAGQHSGPAAWLRHATLHTNINSYWTSYYLHQHKGYVIVVYSRFYFKFQSHLNSNLSWRISGKPSHPPLLQPTGCGLLHFTNSYLKYIKNLHLFDKILFLDLPKEVLGLGQNFGLTTDKIWMSIVFLKIASECIYVLW